MIVQRTLQEWVNQLEQIDLPVIRKTHESLLALSGKQPNVGGAEVAKVVLPDPMMVLRVMRMVNSGRKGRLAQPVLTVEHAVMMTGLGACFNRMLAAPVLEEALDPDARDGLLSVVMRAGHAAFQARDWAVQRHDLNIEEVYIAALLQEVAAMLMWVAAPHQMQKFTKLSHQISRGEAEQEVFGFSLDELTLALLRNWTLPPLIVGALEPEACEAHVRQRLVSVSRSLARNTERGWHGEGVLVDLGQLSEGLRITLDEAVARVHRVSAVAARSRIFPGISPAARWMPLLPGPWPDDEINEQVASEPLNSGQALTPEDALGNPRVSSADAYEIALQQIAAHLDGTMNLNALMQLVLAGMRDGIQLRRVVFALVSQDKTTIRARFIVGAEEKSPLRQFNFDLSSSNLFGKVMEKQQAFWLNGETRLKVSGLISPQMNQVTSGNPFFVMSLAVRGRVVGLFYADNNGDDLTTEYYEKFKKLCTQTAVGMAYLAKS